MHFSSAFIALVCSATLVTSIAVKHHNKIPNYKLVSTGYTSIPPSHALLSTSASESAKLCAEACDKDESCKYFSFYEMLTDQTTYCSYYKSGAPFHKIELMKKKHVKGFKGYKKTLTKITTVHSNGTTPYTKHHHDSKDASSESHESHGNGRDRNGKNGGVSWTPLSSNSTNPSSTHKFSKGRIIKSIPTLPIYHRKDLIR